MKRWLRKHWIALLVAFVIVLALSSIVGSFLIDSQKCSGLLQSLGTEIVGGLFLFIILDRLIGRRELKANLIARMRSDERSVAVTAADELRRHGWLGDGSLQRSVLTKANLEGAWLVEADLSGAVLIGANLVEASLHGADLSEVWLPQAKLIRADLCEVNLSGARLDEVDLTSAEVKVEQLKQVYSLKDATMPDGRKYEQWKAEGRLALESEESV
jgi:hypothetical protein